MTNYESLLVGIIIGVMISIVYSDKNIENLWCDSDKNILCADHKNIKKETFVPGCKAGEPLIPYYEMNRKLLNNNCEKCNKPVLIDNTKYASTKFPVI